MAIRLSGLTSGMDTDAIVQELVSAYSMKTEKYEKASTKLTWKQDAWKGLNTKIYSLYTNVSNLRFSSAYNLRKVSVSDNTKAKVTATAEAATGTQKLNILKTAQSGYITGGELDKNIKSSSTLADLGYTGGESTIEVKKNDGTTEQIKVTKNTKVSEFVNSLKEAGLNANFDETNHRLFVSAKSSGVDNDFTLTGLDENGEAALAALGLDTALIDENGNFTVAAKAYQTAYQNFYLNAADLDGDGTIGVEDVKTYINNQITEYDRLVGEKNIRSATYEREKAKYENYQDDLEKLQKKYDGVDVAARKTELESEFTTLNENVANAQTVVDEKTAALATAEANKEAIQAEIDALDPSDVNYATDLANLEAQLATADEAVTAAQEEVETATADLTAATDAQTAAQTEYDELTRMEELPAQIEAAKTSYETAAEERTSIEEQMAALNVDEFIKIRDDDENSEETNQALLERAVFEMAEKAVKGFEIISDTTGVYKQGSATKIDATDAVIKLNGVQFTSASNSFSINGLSIEATAVTGDGDNNAIQVTTSIDAQGIYDKVKDFLTEYNNVINEMCKLYNAESAGDYEPLTDEEKEAMSDEQIEKWETKIKDSLLRRDTTLNSVMSTMVNAMAQVIEVDGEKLSLSTFGISTLGYLNAAENENYAYHIDGDEDDENTSGKKDKLMAAIEKNPDQIVEFMKQLTGNLYSAIDDKMKSTELSSAYKVYNDKEMDKQLAEYAKTIAKWEEKVSDKEDYYYDKFSQMEVALSKLQNQTSSISGLLNM